jgi:transcriptional regulator with XRE-family HTH domain
MTDIPTTEPTVPDPRRGRGLRVLREAARLDTATFAGRLGLNVALYTACEAGEATLPTAKLPRLAELCDVPLPVVLAEIHGTGGDTDTAELETLARAFTRIGNPDQREAVLQLALVLERDGDTPG